MGEVAAPSFTWLIGQDYDSLRVRLLSTGGLNPPLALASDQEEAAKLSFVGHDLADGGEARSWRITAELTNPRRFRIHLDSPIKTGTGLHFACYPRTRSSRR